MRCACHIVVFGPQYFSILPPHKRGTIFEEKVIEHKMGVLISSATFICNVSHFKENWARYD
jgi:hypothetical protein